MHVERIMRTRVHPPFTHMEYYNAQSIFATRTLADVRASSAMCMWHVKDMINWAKANHVNLLWNHGRNTFI